MKINMEDSTPGYDLPRGNPFIKSQGWRASTPLNRQAAFHLQWPLRQRDYSNIPISRSCQSMGETREKQMVVKRRQKLVLTLDLQHVAITCHHLVEDRAHDAAQE